MMKHLVAISGLAIAAQATSAQASTTTTYSYDALGRLVATSNTGTVNNGLTSATTYDKADNRSNYTIAGASKPDTKSAVVVVPLNGYTVIVTAPAVQ